MYRPHPRRLAAAASSVVVAALVACTPTSQSGTPAPSSGAARPDSFADDHYDGDAP